MHKKLIALALFACTACSPAAPETEPIEKGLVLQEFTASFDPDTRTSLSGTHVLWDASGESIDIINQNGSIYTASQTAVSSDRRKASFSGQAPESGNLYAVYPSGVCTEYDEGQMEIHIPTVQTAVAGGFATRTSPTVAIINPGETLYMRNICSMVGFKVSNSNIKSVALAATEADGGAMTGTGFVEFEGDVPSCYSDSSVGTGHVELHGGLEPGVQYWALVYPGTYTDLKVVFTDTDGRTATFTKDGSLVLERSKGRSISEFTITDADWDEENTSTATLTYEESSACVKGYNNPQIYTNAYGTWAICAFNPTSGQKGFQLNSGKVAYIGTPTMPGNIKSVKIGLTSDSGTSGSFYICSSSGGTSQPSGSLSASCAGTETTIDVTSLKLKQLWIRSSFFVKIASITITYSGGSGTPEPGNPEVTTLAATGVGMADATLNASFSGIPLNPDPVAAFFRWGTSTSALVNEAYDTNTLLNTSNGTFSASLTGLQESTTYYYQAVITLHDGTDVEGAIVSFTTRSPQQSSGLGYLDCYEIPAVDVSGNMVSGNEKYGHKWYKYYTTNSRRAVATHTVKYNNKVIRNYTVMLDADKKSPIWCATAFNSGTWPDNNVGRKGSWTSDPAFPESWQQENGTGSYGKGHFIASNYRQTTLEQNKQTFYLSNQAAQWQTRFNDGIWNNLENAVKGKTPSGSDTLYVVVGILFEGSTTIKDGIYIPSHFYKCIMKCSFSSPGVMTAAVGCAYLFENKEYTSGTYSSYKTTINAVEERAGLDFFHNVPDDLEEAAENAMGSPI